MSSSSLGGNVDVEGLAIQCVEILREALPVPCQALMERDPGNVLDTLHDLDQSGLVGLPDGRSGRPSEQCRIAGAALPRSRRQDLAGRCTLPRMARTASTQIAQWWRFR